jgi:hypothetical protein
MTAELAIFSKILVRENRTAYAEHFACVNTNWADTSSKHTLRRRLGVVRAQPFPPFW